MSQLQQAIQEITYRSRKFPKKAFEIISANREEALPYLRGAIEKVLEERSEIEEEYLLYFYALFLLGEFQDKEIFPKLIELVCLPGDDLDALIGDAVTESLRDVLYNTFNGDMELLKGAIMNEQVDEFARSSMLDVMGQLYLDGRLEENEWKEFLRKCIHSGEEYSYFYNGLASVICQCHFVDMLSEIRYMLDNELMDEMAMGKYDSCVDEMFVYHEWDKAICTSPIKAADKLKGWAMFEEEADDFEEEDFGKNKKELDKFIKQMQKRMEPAPVRKVGRNDPCPCGSGKKYKFCCLNKPKSALDAIESPEKRQKCLERYPQVGGQREEGRVYLEDYYDSESIEIDKLLYLGLVQRHELIWMRDEEAEEKRCYAYLKLAFELFVKKAEKEAVVSLEEYNQRYSIHYYCEDWLGKLLRLLHVDGNKELSAEVEKWCRMLQKTGEEIKVENMNWKSFEKLQEECYDGIFGGKNERSSWQQAFELLVEIVREEREKTPDFGATLESLDDITDYEYDLESWLDECLDEMDMCGKHAVLLQMCDTLLELFGWPEYTGSDLKFRKSSALGAMGKTKESVAYCEEWMEKEPDNMLAAVAGVYAYIRVKEFAKAEVLMDKFLPDKSYCSEENDIMFTAASKLYQAEGKKKEKKAVDKAMREYEERLEEEFGEFDFDEDEDFEDDDFLPF